MIYQLATILTVQQHKETKESNNILSKTIKDIDNEIQTIKIKN